MLHRQQLNVFRLRLLPLFLVALFVLVIVPTYAGSSIQFKSFCDAGNGGTAITLSCTLSGVSTGDTIISNIFGEGVFNAFTTTDGQGNTYSQKISSITGSGSGVSTYIQGTLSAASSGSDAITVTTGGVNRIYEIVISDYSGVTGFGKTGNDLQDNIGNSGTSTVVVSGTSASSIIINDFTSAGSTLIISAGSSQTLRDAANNGGFLPCQNRCQASDSSSSTLSWTWSGGSGCGCFVSQSALELLGSATSSNTSTQCYGNCGNPPITIVNTNSTHLINFNQSITLFYQFQSNLNGVINNVTLNIAQICGSGAKCTVNTLFVAAYVAGSCATGTQPFTSNCPGSRLSSASTTGIQKQRFSMQCPSNCIVVTGQWIAIAVSATFSGVDINDTNTNVPLFQSNGIVPTTISASGSASANCAGCKMGLWAWITGSTVIGGPPPPNSGQCGNGIGDYLTCLTTTFCTGTPNTGCTLAGGLFWSMIYSVVGVVGLMWVDHKFLQSSEGLHIPATAYAFVPLGIQFMFISLGILPLWWGILLIMLLTIMFTSILLGIVKSRQ